MMALSPFAASAVAGQPATHPATILAEDEGGITPYSISALELKYLPRPDGLPDVKTLAILTVPLSNVGGAWAAPRQGLPVTLVKIASIGAQPYTRFYPSAIKALATRLVDYLTEERHLAVVVVEPDDHDLDLVRGQDLRPPSRTAVAINVTVGRIAQVRTVASGQRLDGQERIDNTKLQSIVAGSPVRAATTRPRVTGGRDIVNQQKLDDYIALLDRFPGRKVDVAISPATQPSEVVVDYLVNETKPYNLYAQISNTGTKQTSTWRERLGGTAYQTFNVDDILSLDYTTAGFSADNSVNFAYEGDLFGSRKARWKVIASYSDYQASDLGLTADQFNGSEYHVGTELSLNVWQRSHAFIDLFAGVDAGHIEVDWKKVGGDAANLPPNGDTPIYSAYAGLRYDRITEIDSTIGELRLAVSDTGASADDLQNLGRPDVATSWATLSLSASRSFYLEPLLDGADFRANGTTLAHEIYLSGRAVTTLGRRVIPQAEQILGGFYTVRGYPESAVSGDSALLATLEYRFHLPRLFAPSEPQDLLFCHDFRVAPQRPLGRPDWDFIMRGFLDVAESLPQNGSSSALQEDNQTLVGTGVGIEWQVKQNFSIRADWGVALTKVAESNAETRPGNSRIHLVATFSY